MAMGAGVRQGVGVGQTVYFLQENFGKPLPRAQTPQGSH